jgi:organic radical activating enzyme
MKTILIQNADTNKSQRDYMVLGDKLLVTSTFSTIQGEGPYAGAPAMFVRLSGCNYGSKSDFCGFCDTNFTFSKGIQYTPLELLNQLVAEPGYNKNQVLVVTGGEPTLQHNLLAFMSEAQFHFKAIQIETNGTQPKFYQAAEERGMANLFISVVSPKANMRLGKYPEVHKDVLWWASCLKFVVSADPENAHHEIPDWALASKKPIYVSPMAVYNKEYEGEVSSIWEDGLVNKEETAKNYRYAAQLVMKHQLLLSIQQHLMVGIA